MGARCKHTIVMKVISAYLMAVVGGNDSPSVADVKKILTSVNIELDDNDNKALEELVEELAGQDIQDVLAKGHEKLKPVPGGSAGGAAPAAAGAAPAGGDAGAAAKKESSDDDDAGGAPVGNLFGDDGGDDY